MTTKRCSDCKQDKPVSLFSKDRSRGDGLAYRCRDCSGRRSELRYLAKQDELNAKSKARYHENKPERLAKIKAWQAANPEMKRAARLVYDEKNRARISKLNSDWARNNRDKCNATVSRRRAALLNATPAWADNALIDAAYTLAKEKSKALGCKWSVDHIVPLRSKLVCGLHTHTNLRVIPLTDNKSKGNRHWPDMFNG